MKNSTAPYPKCRLQLRCGLIFDHFTKVLQSTEGCGIKLKHREYQCLIVLDEAFPDRIPRDTVFKAVWGARAKSASAMDVHVSALRQKLKAFGRGIQRDGEAFAWSEHSPN